MDASGTVANLTASTATWFLVILTVTILGGLVLLYTDWALAMACRNTRLLVFDSLYIGKCFVILASGGMLASPLENIYLINRRKAENRSGSPGRDLLRFILRLGCCFLGINMTIKWSIPAISHSAILLPSDFLTILALTIYAGLGSFMLVAGSVGLLAWVTCVCWDSMMK